MPVEPFLSGTVGLLGTTTWSPTGFTALAQLWSDGTILAAGYPGGVAERLIALVLKTGRPKGLVSSNLTPSAIPDFALTRFAGFGRALCAKQDALRSFSEGMAITVVLRLPY